MKKPIISIVLFVLLTPAYPSTLEINEQGDVFVNTERYLVFFEDGAVTLFHNKLTEETYTQNEYRADTWLRVEHRRLKSEHLVPEIKRHSPLEIELIYRDSWSAPRDKVDMEKICGGFIKQTC